MLSLAGQGLEKDLSHCGKRHGCRVVGDVDGFGHKAVEGVFDAERVAFEVGKAELVTVFGNIDPVHFGCVHLARNTCKREGQYRAFLLDLDVLKLQNALKVPVDKLACKLVQSRANLSRAVEAAMSIMASFFSFKVSKRPICFVLLIVLCLSHAGREFCLRYLLHCCEFMHVFANR